MDVHIFCGIKNATITSGGAIVAGAYEFTPGELQGGATCDVVVTCDDDGTPAPVLSDTEGPVTVTIAEDNQDPTIAAGCPASTPEDTATACTPVVADTDIPAQTLTCSDNVALTNCTGVVVVADCSTVTVAAQGAAAGPGSCDVSVQVSDGNGGIAIDTDTIIINDVVTNLAPYWAIVPSPMTTLPNDVYNQINGQAADDDLPAQTLTCSNAGDDCSFVVAVSGSGTTPQDCTISFTSGASLDTCSVNVDVSDGISSVTQAVNINVIDCMSGTIFVDDTATGVNDGTSWTDAFTDIQSALDVACAGTEVWVAQGNYTSTAAQVVVMKDEVDMYGGFIGDELLLSNRGNPGSNPSVIDAEWVRRGVIGSNMATLDGFSIRECDTYENYGCGIIVSGKTGLSINNCKFKYNFGPYAVIGPYQYAYYLSGAAIGIIANSDVSIDNCSYRANGSAISGGAIFSSSSYAYISNTVFQSNRADYSGGSVHVENSTSPNVISNCIFTYHFNANGAVAANGGDLIISNSTFVDNTDSAIFIANSSTATVVDSISWLNTEVDLIKDAGSVFDVTYSDIEGGYPGTGNINIDPLFVSNYRLSQIISGQGVDSPCVDTGSDTALNVGLDRRSTRSDRMPDTGQVDMGYHYSADIPWYVDKDAVGAGTGLTWADAFTHPQDAINAASGGDMIWVAEGTYTTQGAATDSVITFSGGVEIYGGFVGTETSFAERGDPVLNPTILDGLNTSYHVITPATNVLIDGFSIINGNANGVNPENKGGGIKIDTLDTLTISNCYFMNNTATNNGGAIHLKVSELILTNCTFSGNSATNAGALFTNNSKGYTTVADCLFDNNSSTNDGGAIRFSQMSSPTVSGCIFRNNSAEDGGAIDQRSNSVSTFENCLFYGNTSTLTGSAVFLSSAIMTITNSTFNGNVSGTGATMNISSGGSATITDSAMYDNNAVEISVSSGTATVTYSDIEGGYTGTGNIDAAPEFINVPILWDVTSAAGTTTTITVADSGLYAVNDVIEIDNDDIARTVSASGAGTVTFSPALGAASTAGMLVENWGVGASDLIENYRLSQTAAGEGVDSPCLDTGSDTAANLGMDTKTTRTDNFPDTGQVDMGYHYEIP